MTIKYILFAGNLFYPNGGVDDIKGVFDSVDEAKAFLFSNEFLDEYKKCHEVEYLWGEVYCVSEFKVVSTYREYSGWVDAEISDK